ncbi:MAG TPA: tetratricopeptide repeat protein [Casimicrobiaceae bacterium]|nr:tetratricopeptide repeat protein [Casimicrobiaceae bacterium]
MKSSITRAAVAIAAVLSATALAQPLTPPEPPQASTRPAPAQDGPGLAPDVFYRLMLADVALQRGEPALAARALLEVAQETREASIAQRATEVALFARQRAMAGEAAKLWQEIEPTAERPKQILAALAAGGAVPNRFHDDTPASELRARLEKFLADTAATGAGVGEPFLQLNRVLAQQSDKTAVYRLIADLARPYPNSAEAHFAVGLAALNTGLGDPDVAKAALDAADRALVLKPDWDRALLLKAEVVGKRSSSEAIALLEDALKRAPASRPLASALAQALVEEKRFGEARTLYRRVFEADRTQREMQFGIAVLSIQMKDWDAAEADLHDLKQAGFGEPGQVDFYLAQVAEERGRLDDAITRYRAVADGERGWLAKLRIATVMGKQGKRGEARKYLADLPAVTIEQRVQVRQTEAQLFRDANDHKGALAVIDQALAELPDSTDLIYDRAMVLEKLDRIDDAEKSLRRLVELKPGDAQSLNALGYTLVDRTTRLDEGFKLIEQAHKLAPNDPFIMDSMGWAHYRLGRLDEAERYLMRAFAARPDPEIAAHLGEVLWARGQPQKAREIWQSQLIVAPDHPVLLETMRRLQR